MWGLQSSNIINPQLLVDKNSLPKNSLPRSENLMSFLVMNEFFTPPQTEGRGKIKEGITEGGDRLKEGLATHGYIVGYFLCNGFLYLGISIATAMVISSIT